MERTIFTVISVCPEIMETETSSYTSFDKALRAFGCEVGRDLISLISCSPQKDPYSDHNLLQMKDSGLDKVVICDNEGDDIEDINEMDYESFVRGGKKFSYWRGNAERVMLLETELEEE